MSPTDRDLHEILRITLGIGSDGEPMLGRGRNSFVAGPHNIDMCTTMVLLGLMKEVGGEGNSNRIVSGRIFAATELGKEAVIPQKNDGVSGKNMDKKSKPEISKNFYADPKISASAQEPTSIKEVVSENTPENNSGQDEMTHNDSIASDEEFLKKTEPATEFGLLYRSCVPWASSGVMSMLCDDPREKGSMAPKVRVGPVRIGYLYSRTAKESIMMLIHILELIAKNIDKYITHYRISASSLAEYSSYNKKHLLGMRLGLLCSTALIIEHDDGRKAVRSLIESADYDDGLWIIRIDPRLYLCENFFENKFNAPNKQQGFASTISYDFFDEK